MLARLETYLCTKLAPIHGEHGPEIFDIGIVGQIASNKAVIGCHVGYLRNYDEVGIARDHVALHDFIELSHLLLERRLMCLALPLENDLDEDEEALLEENWIEDGHICENDF